MLVLLQVVMVVVVLEFVRIHFRRGAGKDYNKSGENMHFKIKKAAGISFRQKLEPVSIALSIWAREIYL